MSHQKIQDLRRLAEWLDTKFLIPGTDIRFGLDSLLGVIPGVGDSVTLLFSAYFVRQAHTMGVPKRTLARMIWNVFLDWLIGLVPFFGDIFDVGWKANVKNIELLQSHIDKTAAPARDIL